MYKAGDPALRTGHEEPLLVLNGAGKNIPVEKPGALRSKTVAFVK
jgi:hypothetical protein